jgi:hypothetical protein
MNEISRKNPNEMDRQQCLDEIHALKEQKPPQWDKRCTRLVRRIQDLERELDEIIIGQGADNGDDPLDQRIRAAASGRKPNPWHEWQPANPLAGFEVRTNGQAVICQESEQLKNGKPIRPEPSRPFDYDLIHVGDRPSEAELRMAREDRRRHAAEVVARTLGFINRDGNSDDKIVRRVALLDHYVHPIGNQTELAARLGISQQSVSNDLVRIEREIIGI